MTCRRAFVAGTIAAAALPAFAKKPPEPPKVGAIRWPGPGYELHGYMAVPAKAHGPQPAVLVIPDTSGADQFALGLTDALARAGFVACLPRALASPEEAVATLRWLASNRYATGKVGAIGFGWGDGLVAQLAAAPEPGLSCGILLGAGDQPAQGGAPVLRLPALAASTDPATYADAWDRAIAFLRAHLGLPDKRRKP